MIFVLLALLVASSHATGNCVSRLHADATFTATSGTPGFPSIDGSPWIPTVLDNEQTLTVDMGSAVWINKVRFAGDASKNDTTNQIRLSYSRDGSEWTCISNGSPCYCRPFYSEVPPPVLGSRINGVTLPCDVYARFFRFRPLEPSPKARDGASSLRVDIQYC